MDDLEQSLRWRGEKWLKRVFEGDTQLTKGMRITYFSALFRGHLKAAVHRLMRTVPAKPSLRHEKNLPTQ
jgi:hypothetical protein